MKKTAKARLVVFTIIHILLCLSVFLYAKEYSELLKEMQIEYADEMNIDGSDFSGLFNLGISAFNNIFSFVSLLFYDVAMTILSAFLVVPFRLIAIRTLSEISDFEVKTTLKIILTGIIIVLLTGIMFVGIIAFIPILMMFIPVLIFEFFFYWFGLKSKNRNKDEEG